MMSHVWIVYETSIDYKNSIHYTEIAEIFASEKSARTYCESKKKEYIFSCAGTVWGYRTFGSSEEGYERYLTITRKEVKP